MRQVAIGCRTISGLCIGGNPFSGFSHQGAAMDREMRDYFTPDRILRTLREAEDAGVNTFFGRTDDHILGIVRDHWKEGGTLQWFAQVSPSPGAPESWRDWLKAAADLGAAGAYIHGGVVDHWHATGRHALFEEALELMRRAGVAAGFAGHQPDAHQWIDGHLEVDFQMCSHYNPTDRSRAPEHRNEGEVWSDEDRDRMVRVIAGLRAPAVHYKVFAGGNRPVEPAFRFLGCVVRPQDAVLVGVYTRGRPDLVRENVRQFETHVDGKGESP